MRVGILLMCCAALAGPLSAQRPKFSFAIEYRAQVGEVPDSTDRSGGFALRAMADGTWNPYFGWRLEGAYTQAQYERRDPLGTTPVSETGFEAGASARATQQVGTNWRPYAVGGTLISLRGSCTIDNAFNQNNTIACSGGNTVRIGWAAGAGVRYVRGLAGWDWFFETRVLGNVTSNGGGKSLAFAFGAGV